MPQIFSMNGEPGANGPKTSAVPSPVYGIQTLDCSEEEWQERVDLAAAYRLLHKMKLNESIFNHLTAEIPGSNGGAFLVLPFGLMWNEVTASNLLTVDVDGKVLRGDGIPEETAFVIHSRIHTNRPNSRCVMHTHQPWATALCCLEDPRLPMIHQQSQAFYNDIAYDPDYNGLVVECDEGDRLAQVMGDKHTLLHSNHGVIVAAESIARAFDYIYYLERAANLAVTAMSTGKKLKLIRDTVAASFKQAFDSPGGLEYSKKSFEAYKRELMRQGDADFLT
ncbi:hypothetical protein WJX72_002827 [[Myrmecia] bisecta]|uniref:Class II aldolase/adducin N-terminal domain-containing protein n=1 Tax=[Myrmecia] bisecta TaxID=41462 RepID=A0AAW1PWT1_9CHLO